MDPMTSIGYSAHFSKWKEGRDCFMCVGSEETAAFTHDKKGRFREMGPWIRNRQEGSVEDTEGIKQGSEATSVHS